MKQAATQSPGRYSHIDRSERPTLRIVSTPRGSLPSLVAYVDVDEHDRTEPAMVLPDGLVVAPDLSMLDGCEEVADEDVISLEPAQ